MGWTSSTAVIEIGAYGATSTYSNNALIVADNYSNNNLEVYGTNNTISGGDGNDTIGAVMYTSAGFNGNNNFIIGGAGNDALIAMAIQGQQNATLGGALGNDNFAIGCNRDATINVVLADLVPGWENVIVFYEDYHDGTFTCYSSDIGLIFRDDAGRMNVTIKSVFEYDEISDKNIYLYPHGYRGENVSRADWQYVPVSSVMNYGGHLAGHVISDNTLTLNDYHNGGVLTNGVYGLENIIVIDNTQSHDARFLGGNTQANYIFAGSGGDTLWGGANNDVLIGGAGSDNFIYNAGEGADAIVNSNWLDTVSLYDLNLNNIAVFAEAGAVALVQDANNSVTIQYEGNYSPLIRLADNSTWRYNNENSSWQNF